VPLIDKEIEDTGCGYKITGRMGMAKWFEGGIETNPQRAGRGWHRAWGKGHSEKPYKQLNWVIFGGQCPPYDKKVLQR
jgi:hypothetical protein